MIEVLAFVIGVGVVEDVIVPTYEAGKQVVAEHVVEYFKAIKP